MGWQVGWKTERVCTLPIYKWVINIRFSKGENIMKAYLLERLKEASTWRGIVALLTAIGVTLSPAQGEAIIALGLAAIGTLGVFTADKK
jgi:hypothetical protein